MPKCTKEAIGLGRIGRRRITANFDGGEVCSDGGLMLLRRVDERIGLTRAIASVWQDDRDPERITHELSSMIRQRLYALCQGYEDLNDHGSLRQDMLMQTAVGNLSPLASAPTLCRLENRATAHEAAALHGVLIDQFIQCHTVPPEQLILDVDASDIPLHGEQELKEFHGYYDHYCYLPLYVFCGQHLLACTLRRSRIDGAKNVTALIKRLVSRLRAAWPQVRIVVRGDSGFCRQRLLNWCERHGVDYLIGVARNARLEALVQEEESRLEARFEETQAKQRCVTEFRYAAASWPHERRILARLEYGSLGNNPRFVVTTLEDEAGLLYDDLYCQRGEAENRIKECQLDLFGTRASCHSFMANQIRLLLAGLAYTLMVRFRQLALSGTALAQASAHTIRVRLLKIGAVVVRNTRRIMLMLASNHPLRELYRHAVQALAP